MPISQQRSSSKGSAVFKLRRRTAAVVSDSSLPFCAMCNTTIRIDVATSRCALGHRVVAAPAAEAVEPVLSAPTTDTADLGATAPADGGFVDGGFVDDGRYDGFADETGGIVTWDDVASPVTDEVYDDYLSWDEPLAGTSSLDVDTAELPAAPQPAPLAPATELNEISSDLLDELDDATHARRRAVGTVGGTIAVTALTVGSIAMLPF